MGKELQFGNSDSSPNRQSVTTLLMIDDDEPLVDLTRQYLQPHGYELTAVHDGTEALSAIEKTAPALVILDIMLPGLDGFEVCKQIRRESRIPILMLTARGEDTDRILGLELGADDYLSKPFNPRELLARIKAILRRAGEATKPEESDRYEVEGIVLDMGNRTVTVRNQVMEFTTAEFELLRILMANPGRALSRDQIMNKLHGADWEYFDRSIDVLVSRVRQKIEENPRRPTLLKTIRSVGYQFIQPKKD